ncbi:isopenicillin N synthase family dioxygenase [Nocardia sp. NBC_01327]|uniref:isopenicillin N synthase family dioxygenase n=1 Tax=Nocardia sp. NBC_01327 TaxID=2903593 RepID=UPI002E0E796B|nr:isopenicillin N synthase family oxygenase [Nocardia sp. NBC_01327]
MTVVPLIDLSLPRERVAAQIDQANHQVGFFGIVGHRVDPHLLDEMYTVTTEFFDLPIEEKLRYRSIEPGISRGYMPPKSRALAQTRGRMTPADLVEFYSIGALTIPPDDPYYSPAQAGVNFRPNIWPRHSARFREVWSEYYRAMEALAADLMRLFALALRLPEAFFDNHIDRHISNLFANHYPPLDDDPEPGQLRVGEHSDYGSLTLLYQRDEVGGLQVHTGGRWHPVAPVPDSFVINIGDLMQRWSNNRWVSTLHRVQNPPPGTPAARRLSFPFFCQPNYDTLIETLPTCKDTDTPDLFEPITSGANMIAKTESSFAL